MGPIKIILHPTDFSGRSQDGFRLACSLRIRPHAAKSRCRTCKSALQQPARFRKNILTSYETVRGRTDTPKGTRTPVFAVRGRCPRPLDDGGMSLTECSLSLSAI